MGKELPAVRDDSTAAEELSKTFVDGVSASMRPVEAVIGGLSQSDVPVLLLAEAGAGKRATPRRVHEKSPRSAQPFQTILCLTLGGKELQLTLSKGEGSLQGGAPYFG